MNIENDEMTLNNHIQNPAGLSEDIKDEQKGLPMIPMRGMSVFPGMVVHFDIGRDKSIQALETAMTRDQIVFLTEQKDIKIEDPEPEDIYSCLLYTSRCV